MKSTHYYSEDDTRVCVCVCGEERGDLSWKYSRVSISDNISYVQILQIKKQRYNDVVEQH